MSAVSHNEKLGDMEMDFFLLAKSQEDDTRPNQLWLNHKLLSNLKVSGVIVCGSEKAGNLE